MKRRVKTAKKKHTPASKKRVAAKGSKSPRRPGPPLAGLPPLGAEATIEVVIPHESTIQYFNPDLPPVLSTPQMIQLMEHASTRALLPQLEPGTISVGTRIEVDHLKAVSHGATVHAWAKLVAYQGRFLIFDVEARAGDILIGRGRVFRAIVHSGNHGDKARARTVSGS